MLLYVIYKFIHHRNENVLLHFNFGWFSMNTHNSRTYYYYFFSFSLWISFTVQFCSINREKQQTAYRFIDNSIWTEMSFLYTYLWDDFYWQCYSLSLYIYIFLDMVSVEIKTMELNLWNQIGEFAAETKAKWVREIKNGYNVWQQTTWISNGRNILWLLILDCHINLSTQRRVFRLDFVVFCTFSIGYTILSTIMMPSILITFFLPTFFSEDFVFKAFSFVLLQCMILFLSLVWILFWYISSEIPFADTKP